MHRKRMRRATEQEKSKVLFDDEIWRLYDGSKTMINMSVKFDPPIPINSRFNDSINIDINDDFSGFSVANAIARGAADSVNLSIGIKEVS